MDENRVETGAPALSSAPTGEAAAPAVDVAQQQPTPQADAPAPVPAGYVPQKDLDGLRSSLQRQADTAKAEADRYRAELQQVQQTQAITSRAQEYYAAYIAEGHDPAQAEQAALYYAQEDYQASLAVQSDRTDAQRYREQQQQQSQARQLVALRDELLTDTGLTADELRAATSHLDPSMPRFEAQVRRAATTAALAKAKAGDPSTQARQVRQGMMIPGGGSAGGPTLSVPQGMSKRSPEYRQWLLQAQRQLEQG